jgi:hypothetical protein
MPQLAIETFFSQYFWLVIFLSVLYYLIVSNLIPNVGSTIKIRELIELEFSDLEDKGPSFSSIIVTIKETNFSILKFL